MRKLCPNCSETMQDGGTCSYCGHSDESNHCDCQYCDEAREQVAEEAELREGGTGS